MMDQNPDNFDFLHYSPLMKKFSFQAYLVAGFTPITTDSALDYFINRPNGMKGYIINLTLTGQGDITSGNDHRACHAGDLLLFPPGIPHYYGRATHSDSWDHLWVYFRPRGYWLDWLNWHDTGCAIGQLTLPSQEKVDEVVSLFKSILTYSDCGSPLSEALAMNALEKLLLHCQQLLPIHNSHQRDPRIHQVCQYLNEHLDRDIKIEELAQRVYLSPSRLAHLFRQELNTTILCWREEQRINRAKSLLQVSQQPIAKIAETVGYEDQLYFSRIFRKHLSVSPSQYRRNFDERDRNGGEME
ncbi:DNA-binding transcriptional regulator AraC [Rahnella sikkimica]|uniref:Arabinose operon regulatory protein n=2 Tax=Rahnella sikkimica TaxID=1805933 RepID=A0A2L1UPD5_9GAMM|nr:DNA-binding transcriptional regulator AraC [Rahnella sikkimica]